MKWDHDYMTTGKDKEIVDPDPDKINSHRKEKQYTSTDIADESEELSEFLCSGCKNQYKTSL